MKIVFEKMIVGRWKLVMLTLVFAFRSSLITSYAQVGEYRTDFALGVNGGYVMSNVSFVTKVPQ